jgi:hypothetical protein
MTGYRKWQGCISIGVSGPESSFVRRTDLMHPIEFYPKMLAQLHCTSADSTYLAEWFASDHAMGPSERCSIALREPEFSAVKTSFDDLGKWFEREAEEHDGFDGGELVFTFSGHGREGDGTLFLHDETYFGADDFVDACLEVHRRTNAQRAMNVAVLLDSCYSGEFLLRTLQRILGDRQGELGGLRPEYMLASSMPDEASWESSELRHGMSTYCFSVHPQHLGAITAASSSSESGMPLSWSFAAGPDGCSYITHGSQNPIVYDAYRLRTAFTDVSVWAGEPYGSDLRSKDEWEADLVRARNSLRDRLEPFRNSRIAPPRRLPDDQIPRYMHDLIKR